MEIDGLYQLEDVQLYPTGEQVLNVWFFQSADAAATAEDLTLAFNNDMLSVIQPLQSEQFYHTTIRAFNLGNPADFYERTLVDANGTQAADCLPAYVAVNFTLRAATRDVRPGSKRIGGIPDISTAYTNGVIVNSFYLADAEALRAQMSVPVTAAGPAYENVIVKRIPYVNSKGNDDYRLPETSAEAVYYPVAAALFNNRLSHQVSRGNSR